MAARKTPVMQQHAAAKQEYPDAVLFFRLGDFYEMFGDDAVLCSRELDLTLTSRNKGQPDEIPMAGVPHHAAHGYLAKLLDRGYKVAICEQMADPAKTKGIVPREVVRVVTPGQITDTDQLRSTCNNWLAAIEVDADGVGVALLDLSTAELRAARFDDAASGLGELVRAMPREILLRESQAGTGDQMALVDVERSLSTLTNALEVMLPQAAIRRDGALSDERLRDALGDLDREASRLPEVVQKALGRALDFVRRCNPNKELPFVQIGCWDPAITMVIDPVAQAHLELVDSVSSGRDASLLGILDTTRTPMGARLLRRRLLAPLLDVEAIRRRLDVVESFVVHQRLREELRASLTNVRDIERLAVRSSLGEATARDLAGLRDGLGAAAQCVRILADDRDIVDREVLDLDTGLDTVDDLQSELARALVERPPNSAKEGPVFVVGFDAELDELDELRRSGTERMVALEAELRSNLGIPNLKVKFTRVFGWYIEVTRSQASKVPKQWRRKQTVAAGERYTTAEVDELADRLAHAEEEFREREQELFRRLVEFARCNSHRVRRLAGRIAQWDVASALAEVAHRNDYCRPDVDESDGVEIVEGRHPVVERRAASGRFVPNDVLLEIGREHLWLVTGPNMAGKSTFLRQTALVTILAQMGSYVPAKSARIGIVDRVLSRVGASDNLARGESTFMVEMRETSEILRYATRRSLVILDEIGRGTSTFDGLAIAWAVAEHLDEVIGCRALFATHYHELTSFADASEHAGNYSVSARELGEDIVFLHRLVQGAASRSYGIAVARLAGLPEAVLARARTLLATFEEGEVRQLGRAMDRGSRRRTKVAQLNLFGALPSGDNHVESEILATIRGLDLNRVAPLEALQVLSRIQNKLGRQ